MITADKLFRRRKQRTRSAIRKCNKHGRIRLSVFRSNQHIYAQLIDDVQGITLASASTLDTKLKGIEKKKLSNNIDTAKKVGILIAERAQKINIKEVVFDKGGYMFHGRVKALADSARENGLLF
ncbi:Ribosomal protein L18 [Rickettsiales bacterium Ac37b]|nr:Ribosomal protein L18 [Rickettsiales bacterium Ac37b]